MSFDINTIALMSQSPLWWYWLDVLVRSHPGPTPAGGGDGVGVRLLRSKTPHNTASWGWKPPIYPSQHWISLINDHSHFSGAAQSSFLISSYSLESRKKIATFTPSAILWLVMDYFGYLIFESINLHIHQNCHYPWPSDLIWMPFEI